MNLFSTEQVSKYHPDKVADQISDAILTECLKQDPTSHVAVECLIKSNLVVLAGEVKTKANINYKDVASKVLRKLHYLDEYEYRFEINISEQSPEIDGAVINQEEVDELGAGDQGIMIGYADRTTQSKLPWPFELANKIINLIETDVEKPNSILKGDAKTQVTADMDNSEQKAKLIIISVCHKSTVTFDDVKKYIKKIIDDNSIQYESLIVNPGGPWTIGGPTADCGLTGRKIVCDSYGGFIPVGGGAFSGKDPTKVDRSASYMARHIALRTLEKFPQYKTCEIRLAYGIGIPQPVSVAINVTPQFADMIEENRVKRFVLAHFDLTPKGIIETLNLLNVDYEKLAEGCHYRYDWTKTNAC